MSDLGIRAGAAVAVVAILANKKRSLRIKATFIMAFVCLFVGGGGSCGAMVNKVGGVVTILPIESIESC